MFKVCWLSSLLLVTNLLIKDSSGSEIEEECAKKCNIGREDLSKIKPGVYENENAVCFDICSLKKQGFVNEDGTFLADSLMEQIISVDKSMNEEKKKKLRECLKSLEKITGVEELKQLFECATATD